MQAILDPDVQAVAEFMQTTIPMDRLQRVAGAVAALAPVLWGDNRSLQLAAAPILHSHPSIQLSASGPASRP